jgi:hypothetical protein
LIEYGFNVRAKEDSERWYGDFLDTQCMWFSGHRL